MHDIIATMSSSQDWITSGVTIIILDLIAGLLVSLNLLVRRRWWGQLNKRVSAVLLRLRHNEETQAIFTLSIAALVILVVIGFVVYGLSVDIPRGKFTADELIQQRLLSNNGN